MAQLAKMASVCRLCESSVANSHHRFEKKASQEGLAARISALLDITLNDDEGLPNLLCAKCKRRVESLETAMMDLTKFNKEVSSCAATFLASRRDGKRIKNSNFGVSLDTAKARPPAKKMSHKRLDFGPSTITDECRWQGLCRMTVLNLSNQMCTMFLRGYAW